MNWINKMIINHMNHHNNHYNLLFNDSHDKTHNYLINNYALKLNDELKNCKIKRWHKTKFLNKTLICLETLEGKVILQDVGNFNNLDQNQINELSIMKKNAINAGYNNFELVSNYENQFIPVKTKKYHNDYGIFERPTLEYIFMNLALQLSARSTCLRKKVGAVFTDINMQHAFCLGYNGSQKGGPNQCESLEVGKCNCIHAEINALTKNNSNITGGICFVTLSPCNVCAKVLVNRELSKVIYLNEYRCKKGLEILKSSGIEVINYNEL
jgi:dCMP deaminase